MTVKDLIDLLEMAEPEHQVRLMSQANWPFEYSIEGTWTVAPEPDACGYCGLTKLAHEHGVLAEPHDFEPYDPDRFAPAGIEAEGVIYIVEGGQLGYGAKAAWEEVERPY